MHIYALIGPVCNKCEKASDRPKKLEARIRKYISDKKLTSYPDDMEMYDFERMVLQVCYMYLANDAFRANMKKHEVNPLMYVPSQFALAIKEQIIDVLPRSMVKTAVNSGMERWHSGGSFYFVNDTIPKAVVLEGLERLDIPFPAFLQAA